MNLMFLAAASVIVAPPEIRANLTMRPDGGFSGIVENVSKRDLQFPHVSCKVYDKAGVIVDVVDGYVVPGALGAGEAARFDHPSYAHARGVRFVCTIRHAHELED